MLSLQSRLERVIWSILVDFDPDFREISWLYFEGKSLKLNLIRKSMKLLFSELGNIFSKIFTIIWAFTAL